MKMIAAAFFALASSVDQQSVSSDNDNRLIVSNGGLFVFRRYSNGSNNLFVDSPHSEQAR